MNEWQETEIISKVPATWREYKLDEIGEFKNGANFNAQAFGFGYPVVNVKHLYKGRYAELENLDEVKTETIKKIDEYELRNNDLLFARSSVTLEGTGQVAMVKNLPERKFIFSGFIIRFRCTSSRVYSPFLSYLLRTKFYKEHFVNIAADTSIINLSQDTLKKISVYIPDVEEQKAIASVLSSLDDKIDLLHRQNTTLEHMAETLFRQWFVEEAQEDWEEVPLRDVCSINNGYAFQSETYRETGQKIIRTMNFNNHWIEFNSLVYVSEELAKSFEKFYLRRNDFLLVMVGASLGNFAIVTNDVIPSLQNQNMWCFRSHKTIFQHYLNFAMRYIINNALNGASGSAREFFQKGVFYEIKIQTPPNELIQKFHNIFESYFSKIELNRKQIKTLENLSDNLLPKLMSGEVRVEIEGTFE
ncbi:MAG: restriction endonuclease subunit S [Methylophilaceae bacterium]|nr:restriction endonuclease subunit S [Methylophilaceae bacterium]